MTDCLQGAFSSGGGGGGATTDQSSAALTSDFSTTSTSFTDATGVTVTVLDSSGGVAIVTTNVQFSSSTTGNKQFSLEDDGTRITRSFTTWETQNADALFAVFLSTSLASNGSVIQLAVLTEDGTLAIKGSTSGRTTSMETIGVA